jgi:hypothetical protein
VDADFDMCQFAFQFSNGNSVFQGVLRGFHRKNTRIRIIRYIEINRGLMDTAIPQTDSLTQSSRKNQICDRLDQGKQMMNIAPLSGGLAQ